MPHLPQPSIPDPRRRLLDATLAFVRVARDVPGVRRIALIGSLATDKPVPKDTDLLVTIDSTIDLAPLAAIGRRLKGTAQSWNLGADIFLIDADDRYLGRICRYRECHHRAACFARSCGRRPHLNDDLDVITLGRDVVAAPAIDLWPQIVARCTLPADVDSLLVVPLQADQSDRHGQVARSGRG